MRSEVIVEVPRDAGWWRPPNARKHHFMRVVDDRRREMLPIIGVEAVCGRHRLGFIPNMDNVLTVPRFHEDSDDARRDACVKCLLAVERDTAREAGL